MKRVFLVVALATAAFISGNGRVSALAEFCPAHLTIQAVSPDPAATRGPASLFGFELNALGARTVSATLAFDTNAGWFKVSTPPVTLTERDRHYSEMFGHATVPDWVSSVMYVHFPKEVKIAHAWVYSASARNDGDFGWGKQGPIACSPPAPGMERIGALKTISIVTSRQPGGTLSAQQPIQDPMDLDPLNVAPAATAVQLTAKTSAPLEHSNCAQPFLDASARTIVSPGFPAALRTRLASGLVGVQMALNADGSVADKWPFISSGYKQFDDAALEAVTESSFSGAIAYCRPVPAVYTTYIVFDSR